MWPRCPCTRRMLANRLPFSERIVTMTMTAITRIADALRHITGGGA
jgi:hypothetical protein